MCAVVMQCMTNIFVYLFSAQTLGSVPQGANLCETSFFPQHAKDQLVHHVHT